MGTAAAVITVRERRVVEALQLAGATSPTTARDPEALGIDTDGMPMRRLRDRAVVREAGAGRVYLDLESWQALRRMRRRIALVMIAIALTVAALAATGTLNR